jgi:hypothetical protein
MIGFPGRRGCASHRAALIEFAAHRTGGSAVRRALDHVDRCRACEDDLAATTLVLHALRRLHEEIARAEPAPDGWARLRARLAATRREPSRLLSGLPGIVAAAGLCAALVGPGAVGGARPTVVYNEAPRGMLPPYLQFEQNRERAREEGLLPEVAPVLPYTGVRIAPPPIAAHLPLSIRREAVGIEEVVVTAALAPASAGGDGVVQRQAGRR